MLNRILFFVPAAVVFGIIAFFIKILLTQHNGQMGSLAILESEIIDKPLPSLTLEMLDASKPLNQLALPEPRPWLLNVWATWCSTCYMEHEFLRGLAQQGITIVGLNYKDEREEAQRWLHRFGDPFKLNFFDPRGQAGIELGVYGAPETFFIDAKGLVAYRHVGELNQSVWEKKLQVIYHGLFP